MNKYEIAVDLANKLVSSPKDEHNTKFDELYTYIFKNFPKPVYSDKIANELRDLLSAPFAYTSLSGQLQVPDSSEEIFLFALCKSLIENRAVLDKTILTTYSTFIEWFDVVFTNYYGKKQCH